MSRAMRDIASHLRSINPRLHLSYQHTAEAYQATDFILSRVDRIVYITVKFPVTPLHHAFTLYDVRLFNVALPDDSRHVTRLNTDYVAFAYAPELIHYMEFQSPPPVVRNMLHLSHVPETFKRNAAPSCIFALFRNDMDLIRSLCTFTFLHNALQTSVISLDESTLLFTNISNIIDDVTTSLLLIFQAVLSAYTSCHAVVHSIRLRLTYPHRYLTADTSLATTRQQYIHMWRIWQC